MTHRYRITPLAASDLDGIYDYIALNNRTAAGRWLGRCTELFRKLAATPGLGRSRPELGEGIRSFPLSSYVVFYRIIEEGVQILRVLHGARDIEALFTERSDQGDDDLEE